MFKWQGQDILGLTILVISLGLTSCWSQADRQLFPQTQTTPIITPPTKVSRGGSKQGKESLYIPPPPPNRGKPARLSKPGQGRTTSDSYSLFALLPMDDQLLISSAKQPTFWFFVSNGCPVNLTGCSLQFELMDHAQAQDIFVQNLKAKLQTGLTRIKVTNNSSELIFGQKYRWKLSVIDVYGNRERVVYGDFLHVEPTPQLSSSLTSATTPRERYQAYGKHGLWFELITGIAAQYTADPQNEDLAKDWQEMLQIAQVSCIPLAQASPAMNNLILTNCEQNGEE